MPNYHIIVKNPTKFMSIIHKYCKADNIKKAIEIVVNSYKVRIEDIESIEESN